MRVVILGGTGALGVLLTREFLARYPDKGEAIIYARSPQKLPDDLGKHSQVKVVKGELQDEEAMESALQKHGQVDAVLSALGPALFSGNQIDLPGTYSTLLKLMHKHSCKRFIALSTVSAPDTHDVFALTRYILVALVRTFARPAFDNIVDSARVVRKESGDGGVEYTLARVPVLTSQKGVHVVDGYIGDGRTGSFLSRYAAAEFFVDQLEDRKWIDKAPAISSAPL